MDTEDFDAMDALDAAVNQAEADERAQWERHKRISREFKEWSIAEGFYGRDSESIRP